MEPMDDPSIDENSETSPRFERTLVDNVVEYFLVTIGLEADGRSRLSGLEQIRKAALGLVKELAGDYIWQRDGFNLEIKHDHGLVYLHGATDYGDCVEDEWLIVYILRRLTKLFPQVWARTCDNDGEFLLVEAANVTPKWLSPDLDSCRAWIHDEKLHLIPLDARSPKALTLEEAVDTIRKAPDSLIHSTFVEAEAFYRLEKYPEQISKSIHYSLVTIPRKLAYILHALPRAISPAIEAFYLRDPLAMQALSNKTGNLLYPPKDLVTTTVRFTKVLFAQLRSQHFDAPPTWKAIMQSKAREEKSIDNSKEVLRFETGMKLTCGFEMMAVNSTTSDNRVVREVAIMLEDLKEDGEQGLPSDAEIQSWPDALRDDDERWMDINFADFERELQGDRSKEKEGPSGFGDTTAHADLRKIVSRFEAFLNDESAGVDGVEVDGELDEEEYTSSEQDSEDEDKEVSFDEEEFARMMREMMGLPSIEVTKRSIVRPNVDARIKAPSSNSANSGQNKAGEEDENEDNEIRKLMEQMEAELNEHGALKLEPTADKLAALKGKGKDTAIQTASAEAGRDSEEESDSEEVDVDYNLARNLLESFKSQGGVAGPAGNLLGMMGIQLPRDEDDESNAKTAGDGSKSG